MNRFGFRLITLGVFLFLVSLTGYFKTYAVIVLCVNSFFSFGNGVLGRGLEQKNPITMTTMELKIFTGTASIAERIVSFFDFLIRRVSSNNPCLFDYNLSCCDGV